MGLYSRAKQWLNGTSTYADADKSDQRVDRILAELSRSDRGRELLAHSHLPGKEVTVHFPSMEEHVAGKGLMRGEASVYSHRSNAVLLDPRRKDDELVTDMAHELRHAEQRHVERRNRSEPERYLDRHLQLRKELEAEARAAEALVAMQLRTAGNDGPYKALVGDKSARPIVLALDKEVRRDPRLLHKGRHLEAIGIEAYSQCPKLVSADAKIAQGEWHAYFGRNQKVVSSQERWDQALGGDTRIPRMMREMDERDDAGLRCDHQERSRGHER